MEASAEEVSAEGTLGELKLWRGWAQIGGELPLGPGEALKVQAVKTESPDVLGFAYPLPPVPFALRNERRYPPPTDEVMFRDMYKLVAVELHRSPAVYPQALEYAYNAISGNERDALAWQRYFLKVGGADRLFELWRLPELEPGSQISTLAADADGGRALPEWQASLASDQVSTTRYWILAILGRMVGTSEHSRKHLISKGAIQILLEGARAESPMLKECAVCGLKGLIQFQEGREVVSYSTLIDCLGLAERPSGEPSGAPAAVPAVPSSI